LIAILLLLTSLIIPFSARAETVELKDGRVFDGELVSETQDMMTIWEAAGDAFIEAVYEKTQIRKLGDRSIEDEVNDPSKAQTSKAKSGLEEKKQEIDFKSRERIEYENEVRDIIERIKSLNKIWHFNHYEYNGFREWFIIAGPKLNQFKEKYSSHAVVSYGMIKMVFIELDHFQSALQDMEKASKAYESSVARNLSDRCRATLKQYFDDSESLALYAITKTIKYADMAQAKIIQR
jgi:hypothetical protein